MTRATLRRRLRHTTFWLLVVLAVAFCAKLVEVGVLRLPIAGSEAVGEAVYDFLKDMAVVIVTIAAAWLAAVLQRRSKFIESLEEEWRGIVRTKSELFAYCEHQNPTYEDYLQAFCRISETIDSMRIVYRNVGETDELIGLYPYVPLHDMRRALQTLDPSKRQAPVSEAERKRVHDAILQEFYALRETFLEELDLEEPMRPQMVAASARTKTPGATSQARAAQARQKHAQSALPRPRPDVDDLLVQEWQREHDRTHASVSGPSGNGT